MHTATSADSDERGLDTIRTLTRQMRQRQQEIADLAEQRRQVVLHLRSRKVTYRELAAAMGVSEVTVYKVITSNPTT